MSESTVEHITNAVKELRSILASRSTATVVQMYTGFAVRRANDYDFRTELGSPARQFEFLLSLLLSTPEPHHPRELAKVDWERMMRLLNIAFESYAELFFPSGEELEHATPEWRRVRDVAMPTFLHYFNTGLIASSTQVTSRIEKYVVPFDLQLARDLGISATDSIRVCDWITKKLAQDLEKIDRIIHRAHRDRQKLSKVAGIRIPRATPYELRSAIESYAQISRSDLIQEFGEVGETFWTAFSIGRGEAPDIHFPTEQAIASQNPLIRIDGETAVCPVPNTLYTSLLSRCEQLLSTSAKRNRFFKHRDVVLEGEAALHLSRLLGSKAAIYQSVYESPDGHHEHDIVILGSKLLLVVEVKASPPAEPFRDPERAYLRLKRAFNSDTGLQNAYHQALRLYKQLDVRGPVRLYDRSGAQVVEFDPLAFPHRYCLCVTRDDFGPLATDLALLLEKSPSDPYPWAVNVFDLDALAGAWEFLQWGETELIEYLTYRTIAHGKILSTDELEFAGFHIAHGSLREALSSGADLMQLSSSYSDFFDILWQHKEFGGPAPQRFLRAPVMMDVRQSIEQGSAVFVGTQASPVPGRERNKPCSCGSGKKQKYCCGRGPR
ncbi:MAG TPA: hypothetical protein VLK84_21870 [Longimicrobium sp.]|nr:hypothetical protein [Longimicrobium sp.]